MAARMADPSLALHTRHGIARAAASVPHDERRRLFSIVYGKGQEVDVLFRETARAKLVREVSRKSRDLAVPRRGTIGDRRSIDLEGLLLVGLGVIGTLVLRQRFGDEQRRGCGGADNRTDP